MRKPIEWDYADTGDRRLMAEDDLGRLYVPSKTRADYWDRRLDLRNPLHWRYWLRSRLTRTVVMVEPL